MIDPRMIDFSTIGIGPACRYARDLIRLEFQRTALARVKMTSGLADELREAARAYYHGDREAYDRVKSLTGTTFEGKRVRFRPSDVWSRPLNDSDGNLIGVTFEHGGTNSGTKIWSGGRNRRRDGLIPRLSPRCTGSIFHRKMPRGPRPSAGRVDHPSTPSFMGERSEEETPATTSWSVSTEEPAATMSPISATDPTPTGSRCTWTDAKAGKCSRRTRPPPFSSA